MTRLGIGPRAEPYLNLRFQTFFSSHSRQGCICNQIEVGAGWWGWTTLRRIMIPLHDRYAKPALKLVAERVFAPPTRRFSVFCSTTWATQPWDKLVAVLWVSTPLSPQRAASKPIHVKEPVSPRGKTNYLCIKPFGKLVDPAGLEPTTAGLWDQISAIELRVRRCMRGVDLNHHRQGRTVG